MPYITLYSACALLVTMVIPTSTAECPRLCECKWKSGKESVSCVNANLTILPLNLESSTQLLDLTGNNIVFLKNEEFSKADLVNLQKIFLAKCRIKTIERYAFKNLINLIELDLSYNNLAMIPSHCFDSISELRELKLSGNPIQKIFNNAFLNIPELIRLEMSNCKIVSIESKAFSGLEDSLEWLKLDHNKLSEVMASSFSILKNLHGLELTGNPWNCSCKLRNLREWMILQNVPYDIPPMCQNPKRLYQKTWKNLDLDEFACAPKIFALENKTKGVEGKNVTLSCNIDGVPKPNVKWLLRNRVIANLSGVHQVSGKRMYILNITNKSSELTIHTAEIQDAGVYMCAAENKAGKAEAVVTLSMSKKSPEAKVPPKVLIVSVLFGVLFTIVCCVSAACLLTVRKRRLFKWHSRECRHEDNYEKIEMSRKVCKNVNGGVREDENELVTITRKNGDYRVVPHNDTDHENDDEEEESTLELTTPGTSSDRKWSNEASDDPVSKPKVDSLNEIGQSHRDNMNRNFNSTYGTYKPSSLETSQSFKTGTTLIKCHSPLNTIYTGNSVKQVPDVIGHSPFTKNVSSRAQSENGSVNDINELFCTLPRKRDLSRYKSCDSQSPLLPESRYGSESASSSESFARRLSSVESQRYPITNLNRNRVNKVTSGSLLNLTREDKTNEINSTPLLDVKALETRLSSQRLHQSEIPESSVNPYDYHAAQLERFLEEYRMLQQQLTKMKETCDNIYQEQMREKNLPCNASNSLSAGQSSDLSNSISNPVSTPNSNRSIRDSEDFKNFEKELTKYLMARSPSAKNFNSN